MNKKLYKSANDKMFCGVLAGLAEYLGVDATLIRLIFAVGSVMTAVMPAVIVYIIAAIIIPDAPYTVE